MLQRGRPPPPVVESHVSHRADRSPSSSPVRKKQRLSSPFYDEQIGDISQEYLDTFDRIDFSLSQAQPAKDEDRHSAPPEDGPSADLDSPFLVTSTENYAPTFKVASALSRKQPKETESPSNDWLSAAPAKLPLFQSARTVNPDKITKSVPSSPDKENNVYILPSAAALAAARAKLKVWEADWQDLEELEDDGAGKPLDDLSTIEVAPPAKTVPPVKPSSNMLPPPAFTPLSQSTNFTPLRPRNAMGPPLSTPTPSRPGFQPAGFGSQGRPFRPPTFKQSTSGLSSKINTAPLSTSQIPRTPLPKPSFSTPSRLGPSLLKQTPMTLGSTPRSIGISKRGTSSFKSPFRSPLAPASAPSTSCFSTSASLLKSQLQNRVYPPASKPSPSPSVRSGARNVSAPARIQSLRPLNLAPVASSSKMTLASSGLRPQEYSREELEKIGLNVQELSQVKPATAMHYCFYSFASAPVSTTEQPEPVLLNVGTAYKELLKQGCSLATDDWVTNHWCLILWKMAGMAALDPESEKSEAKKRWCWQEVMKQLRRRYDIELDGGRRPILRRIVTQDSASTIPMVLCVSAILESEDGRPMLEVTDGWYRLRAEIDPALARAVKRGAIREGRKLVVSGARLNSERKDPMEILEAYNSVTLKLSGNSSNLAPWHAKLGEQRQRYISTLHSLTPDGGVISCLDVEVIRTHPFGYIEFVEEEGQTIHVGPRSEADELKEVDKWNKRRDIEISKIREAHEKRVSRYMDYLARLERKAEKSRPIGEFDEMPSCIDNYYDDLEEHSSAVEMLNKISSSDARWLAQLVRQNLDSEQERIGIEFEKELADVCPPRNVRSFQVVVVRDARTEKRSAHRVAQLTVWDAQNIDMSEGSTTGTFAPGQRFLVSNLVPTQHKAWMGRNEPGAEIFMSTRKDTQWIKRKSLG